MKCGCRFTTYERIGENPLLIVKSDGSTEAYDRQKLFRGLLIACAKRPVSSERIYKLIDDIENELRYNARNTIKSKDLGDMALVRLAALDEVAYVRFASVYKDFKSLEEFSSELEGLL